MDYISYDYIFNNFKNDDIFYDKNLKKYKFISAKTDNSVKEIRLIDMEDNVGLSVYNYTKSSRILLSLGIFSNRLKQSVFWNKNILLTEEIGNFLLIEKQEEIVEDYKNMLKDGLTNGLISEKEYSELLNRVCGSIRTI